ncbi:MAG: hypothetical protein A2X59_10455 [Nitrospirae bacterium GWC2_42_7]|nr:MAG: hypothetical protein A2X59_10455 [Nitrospirae bacterium GWC2_42_7]
MKLLDLIPENELKEAVISDYEKKLVLYKLTDERLKKKYEMTFKDFSERNIVKEKSYSWDVESDAMEWEHAVEGIRHLMEVLTKIKETND